MIEQKSIARLEFQKVLERVLEFMPSQQTRAILSEREFAKDKLEMLKRHAELDEAIRLYLGYTPLPGGVLLAIEELIMHADKGGVLEEMAFIDISDTLRTHRKLRSFLNGIEQFSVKFAVLYDIALPLGSFQVVEERIEKCIDFDGRVKNSASPELARLRRQIQQTEDNIKRKIDSFISSKEYADYLQDALVTMRNDRYVIPVKAEHKRRIPGMVHDRSASGSTIFIEPIALMELNNALRELLNQEHEEIMRILRELSQFVGRFAKDILASHASANALFILFGLARYSAGTGSTIAKHSPTPYIRLNKARHPLIDSNRVVPMSLEFGEEAKILIITGPNTGGKTVAMKTVGLLCLMNQFGLAIPADDNSVLPFFEEIYVDIGDEQSIEQSLSTFSSHMVNVVHILKHAAQDALVLLDELGAGTDPQEGAALARSILIHLKKQGSMVFATSHYSEIKQFAMTHEGFENASVEFDIKTLSPTYKLLMGIPGSSNAFEISKKLGMPEEILDQAKLAMNETSLELEGLLQELDEKRKARDDMAIELKKTLKEAQGLRERYEEKLRQISEQRERILQSAKQEARDLLKKTEEDTKSIMKELRTMASGNVDFQHMEAQRQKLAENKQRLQQEKRLYKPKVPNKLVEGDTIYVPDLESKGHVLSAPDKEGQFKAMVGILKMTLNIHDVEKVEAKKEPYIPKLSGDRLNASVQTKLDLRGQDVESARIAVDHFLDQALMGKVAQVEIIHGKGTGVLRSFVQDFLKKHPHVAKQRLGGYHEGGDGVTIATLK